MGYDSFPWNSPIADPVSTPKTPQCPHIWKNYTGLVESFEYCEKCDIKRKDWLNQPVDTSSFEQELLEACRQVVNNTGLPVGLPHNPHSIIYGDPDDTKN